MGDCPIGETDEAGALPEASHLLHLGVPRFFLNYGKRLRLSVSQVAELGVAHEAALAKWQSHREELERLEVRVWELSGVPDPELALVEETIIHVEATRVAQRLAYIRAVLDAAGLLTRGQRRSLVGRPPTAPDAQ